MPAGSEGTPLSYSQRGYAYTHGNNINKDIIRRYIFEKDNSDSTTTDNCAMLCDADSTCKSFTMYQKNGTNNARCILRNIYTAGNNTNVASNDYKNPKNYDKPTTSPTLPATRIKNVITGTPDSDSIDYTAFKNCHGKNCCNTYWNGNPDVTTRGYYSNDRDDHCRSVGAAASGCLPGVVTYVKEGFINNTLECGYNRLDTAWTQNNWTNLSSFGFDSNNIEAIKRAHCNGLSFDELASDVNQCTSVSSFNKDATLLSLISNTWWTDTAQVSKMTTLCVMPGDSIIEIMKTKLRLLPTNIEWSNPVINMINTILLSTFTNAKYGDTLMPIVNSYCSARPNSIECGCINAIKSGISGCTSEDTPNGCSEGYNYKKIIEKTTNATLKATLTSSFKPRCHSAACKNDTANGKSIIKPAPDGGSCGNLEVNVCASKIMAGGNFIDSDVKVACNFPADNGSTVNTGSGGVNSVGGDVTEGSTSILDQKTGGVQNKYIAGGTFGMVLSCICIVIVLVILGLFLFN
jgi:hypothetical protein